jgi:hypothetical protein
MLRTSPARQFHLTPQSFPGAMYPDGGILRGDTRLPSQLAELAILQVHNQQRIPIFWLESRKQAGNALADLLPQRRIRLLALPELPTQGFHRAGRGGPVSVVIDHGVM